MAGLNRALEELRDLARGIHSPILAKGGLEHGLKMLARRSTVPVDLDVRTARHLPEPLEVGAYYVVSEALANAAKHAHATAVRRPGRGGRRQCCTYASAMTESGAPISPAAPGLVGLRDRVEALGGRIALRERTWASPGTSLSVELPLSHDPAALASR